MPPPKSSNKKAYFDYEITQHWEAGVVLQGEEVKSLRSHPMDLNGSYISVRGNKIALIGGNIARYKQSCNMSYEPKRERLLLVSRREIEQIHKVLDTKGVTLIPLEGYFTHNMYKIKFGTGQGKRKFDKREVIKKQDLDREMRKGIGRI